MLTDKEPIDRYDEAYAILHEYGLMAARFSGSYQIPRQPWEMQFFMVREMTAETAKSGATAYLTAGYEATGIQFFRDGASARSFIARFYRGDC